MSKFILNLRFLLEWGEGSTRGAEVHDFSNQIQQLYGIQPPDDFLVIYRM